MPKPRKGESEQKFISRCMADEEARRSFPDRAQRFAFCKSQFTRKGKNMIGTIENYIDNKSKTGKMSIRGFIGRGMFEDGVTDEMVENALNEMKDVESLTVTINSLGGNVFDAFSIFNQLRKFEARVTTEIQGVAASAAAFISQAGDKRVAASNAVFMIHEASGGVQGKKGAVEKLFNLLKKIDGILERTFTKSSNQNINEVRDLMEKEKFMDAAEMLDRGFIDEIGDESDEKPHAMKKNVMEDIYNRMLSDYEAGKYDRLQWDNVASDPLNDILDAKRDIDKFSVSAWPFNQDGFKDSEGKININGLKLAIALRGHEDPDNILDDFDKVKSGFPKYNNSKIETLINIKGKQQTFLLTEKDVKMLHNIQNALGVEDASEIMNAIDKLKAEAKDSIVINSVELADQLSEAQAALEASEKEKAELEEKINSLEREKDFVTAQMQEVLDFKNKEVLKQRAAKIDELFYNKEGAKITPEQREKAIETFVNIEPGRVNETQALFDASVQIWETNAPIKNLEKQNGVEEGVESNSLLTPFEREIEKAMNEKNLDFEAAYDYVANAKPELFEKYNKVYSEKE